MTNWFCGKRAGAVGFVLIAALVVGGLAWLTPAALELEHEQREARAQAELFGKLRLALWRLDSRVSPILAREASRRYNHYSAIFAPAVALRNDGLACSPGTVLEPSPLLGEELPDWLLLHFQVAVDSQQARPQVFSPQAPPERVCQRLQATTISLDNVTPERQQLLDELNRHLDGVSLAKAIRQEEENLAGVRGGMTTLENSTVMLPQDGTPNQLLVQPSPKQQQTMDNEFNRRFDQQKSQSRATEQKIYQEDDSLRNFVQNGEQWFGTPVVRGGKKEPVLVQWGAMVPIWLRWSERPPRLLLARLVTVGERQVCQGVVLDFDRLAALLADEVRDLFPSARLTSVRADEVAHPERTMTALPLELAAAAGDGLPGEAGWTPLRVGLALSWLAAGVALLAVGFGGWGLLDLSERRFRFVSAVTHELRTPLTTLRLYLDMLTGGMIKDEKQQSEYLQTLHTESERLARLVGNVLDFSRLEGQAPRLELEPVRVGELFEHLRLAWEDRCREAGKTLVLDLQAGDAALLVTDARLLQHILGNLIDNACKYSREAADQRVWLRARGSKCSLVLEIEDRGKGVPLRDRRLVFRPFRRGRDADVTAGGVGLGLALAARWSRLLGGRLTLGSPSGTPGACFRLTLPWNRAG